MLSLLLLPPFFRERSCSTSLHFPDGTGKDNIEMKERNRVGSAILFKMLFNFEESSVKNLPFFAAAEREAIVV